MFSVGKGSVGLKDTSWAAINPATEDTLEATRNSIDTDIYNVLSGIHRELKKMNLHLESITDERIKNTDVEV